MLVRSSGLRSWNTWSRLLRNNGGWNRDRTSDSQGGGLGDGDGLVVENNVGGLRTVGCVVSHHNVSGDGDIVGGSDTGNSSSGSDVSQLHSERKLRRYGEPQDRRPPGLYS